MKRASFYAIYILCLLSFKLVSNNTLSNTVSVEKVTLKPEFHAGRVNNLVYRINNSDTSAINIIGDIKLHEGWKLAVPMIPLKINPGENLVQIISINVPHQFLAGNAEAEIAFYRNELKGVPIFSEKLQIKVNEREGLSLELLQSPDFSRSGDMVKALYLVKNTGNNERKIFLEPSGGEILSQPSLTLRPGESSVVEMAVRIPVDITVAGTYGFGLTARISDQTKERVFRNIRVFPISEKQEDQWLRYPVSFSTRYLARGRNGNYYQGYQFEAFGDGYLDEAQKHRFEFMARGPNNFDLSFLGLYDQYYLSYRNRSIDLFAGHKSFSATPLMEAARFGTGVEGSLRLGGSLKFGAYYMEPRFYRNIKSAFTAFTQVKILNDNEVAFYLMQKRSIDQAEKDDLFSISTTLQPFTKTRIELEYSSGFDDMEANNAWRVNLSSQIWKFFVSGNYHHTGKNYKGYYSNSTFYSGNVSFNLTKRLNIGASARQDYLNGELDTLWAYAPFSRNYQIAANYRIGRQMNLRTFWMKYEREDRMPIKQFHFAANSFNTYLSHFINRFGYEIGGEFGKTENLLIQNQDNIRDTYRLLLNFTYRPSGNFYVQAFANLTNQNSFIAANQKDLLWGMSASGSLTKKLRTSIYVQNSYAIEEYFRNRNLFQFNLDYNFATRHKLSINSFYTIFQNEIEKPDYSVALNYTANIGIPLKKTGNTGSVICMVTGVEGMPVSNILVFMEGRSGLTDNTGKVIFKNVKPGIHQIHIDRSALGTSLIPESLMPVNLDVIPGTDNTVNIRLTRGGRISGKISVVAPERIPGSVDTNPPGLENIILELQGANESFRIATGSQGRFIFPLVRPGLWKLVVYKNTIDQRYNLENEVYDIDLEPGQEKEIEIRLVPRQRRVIFSPSAVTLSTATTVQSGRTVDPSERTTISRHGKEPGRIAFGVQIMASVTQVPPTEIEATGLKDLKMFRQGIWYKYYIGKFETFEEARRQREVLQRKFPGAFVIAFEGDEQINLNEALQGIKR